ncbi:ParB family chromosome partitioning protein [Natronospira proteinivora]|uniref:Probable chromosome-partitioning protein ParB n=1 Tax=Natronospira proteinivora TaxID=1807133 RepID=A0ABT1GA72_9GAMM|nr:ParB/RepB/Spo0J family partition protein [Natronospira proteinivora]MCP1728231.1 ParB family chromosome partitioning protein [Natronospira proteinivora]
MAAKKRGLGRGLDALLAGSTEDSPEQAVEKGEASLRDLPVDLIEPGRYQPRTGMDPEALNELADSIRSQGVVQPVVVRALSEGRYELIAGERRWRAAQKAGLHEIPAVIRKVPDQAAIAMALIENIQRENLSALEEAKALARLIEEFELSQQAAAEAVGRSRTSVTNLLRLLDLEPDVRDLVEGRKLEMGHARALLAIKGHDQVALANHVAARGLSVRETEKLVRRRLSESKDGPAKPDRRRKDPDLERLEQDLTDRLGARVALEQGRGGKGKLVIRYTSLDELDGILERIQ